MYPCRTHYVTCGFYCYANHAAADLGAIYEDCWAAAEGVVITAYNFPTGRTGRFVEIQHVDGSRTRYLHLHRIDVSLGQGVMQGQRIGLTGATGVNVEGDPLAPHLHFALWYKTRAEALAVWAYPALTFGMWAVDPVWVIEHQEDDVSKQDAIDALREPLPELGNRSMVDLARVSEDYVASQVAQIEASIARVKGDLVGESKALEWKAFYDAKINQTPIPPPA